MRLFVAPAAKDIPEDAIPLAHSQSGYLCAVDDDAEGDQAIELPEGDAFQVLPETREALPQHIHVVGPSGSGKSTWAGNFARLFSREKGGRVAVISADAADDPALPCDVRLQVCPELADVDLESIADPGQPLLLVFDDVEGIPKKEAKSLEQFRKAALERGRKLGISTINIYHRGASGGSTRDSLGEATGFVVFPRAGLTANTQYMLKNYAGVPGSLLSLLRKLPEWGRSVFVSNSAPPVAIGGRRAALLDPFEIEAAEKQQRRAERKTGTANVIRRLRGPR